MTTDMTTKMTCPRRDEGPGYDVQGEDQFQMRTGMSGAPRLMLCSYCGSLEPGTFLEGLKIGKYECGPTDKSYKIYVHDTARFEGDIEGFKQYGTIAKFYTRHFSEEQAWQWHLLRESGKMKVGYPGYFYQPLYMPGVQKRLDAEAAK